MTSDLSPRRRDAARNRERLLEAAAAAFREEGLGASVNHIATDAGLNVATLYRHFPTKDDLVAAVLDELLEPLAQARDAALESEDVLATFLREAAVQQRGHHGLVDALRRDPAVAGTLSRLREPAIAIVEPIVERAQARGQLRPDFDALDLLIALRMVAAAMTDRHVDVILRGLRP
ncbi:helix-turn-helix transcriptional regulator [Solirubrobacter sp. CPCC 204708]|uniref:TetR/AcrR family transcriptional regulator n=1 Tax=Solirubrobacter deserti TaxID=2282478 RepID=A0ABT4RT08_9ACTN|nr:TetR/AcrR family transcriptional regulator [Solirubrobacter deserti]MBE2315911.1 helix-turn-helix transcriptional regulator [Solirubrobacter deserti]MDA0141590.1 TetR/AcrR family transcriptional regulator [Solirubrobacter deserti]